MSLRTRTTGCRDPRREVLADELAGVDDIVAGSSRDESRGGRSCRSRPCLGSQMRDVRGRGRGWGRRRAPWRLGACSCTCARRAAILGY